MDILTKAKELGRMIADSEEMTKLKKSEVDIAQDGKAEKLLNDYKFLQIEMVRAAKENREKEVVDGLKEKLLSKQEEVNNYSVTKDYLTAKSNFDKFMKTINDVIIFSITGEVPCSQKNCGSCSGCK